MHMSWLKSRKSPWVVAAIVFLAVLGLLGSLRWPLSAESMTSRIQHALERNTGYVVERFGDVTFSALPWPTLQITGLQLRKPGSPHERVAAPLLKARINVGSWIMGDPKVVSLTLFDPVLELASSDNFSESEALSTSLLNFLGRDARPELRMLRVTRGTIMLDGKRWINGLRLNVSNEVSTDLRVRAQGLYRSSPVSVVADVEQGGVREKRAIRWAITTDALAAQFSGTLFGPRSLDAEGHFDLTVKKSEEALQRMGIAPSKASLLSGLNISGETRVAWPMVQIRSAVLIRGSQRLDGSVEMILDSDQPKLSATLDTKRLDLTSLAKEGVGEMALDQPKWPNAVLSTDWLTAGTGDLRLSADQVILGDLSIEQAAFSSHLAAGRFEAILSDGKIKNGSAKGRMSLTSGTSGAVDLRMQASLDRVDMASLLEASAISGLRGSSTGFFAVEATGNSLAALAASAEGRAQLTVREGEINGVDIDRLAARIERTMARNVPLEGRTGFQSLVLQSRISAGTLIFSDSQLVSPTLLMPIEGTISLPNRSFDLTGRPLPGGEKPKPGDIRLRIEGPWSNPSMHPDLTGRTNRS